MMAVLSAQYKHPQSAYSSGLKELIDSMLKVNPKERPDINQVRAFWRLRVDSSRLRSFCFSQVIDMTDRVLRSLA